MLSSSAAGAALIAGLRQGVQRHAGHRGRSYDRRVRAGVHETSIVSAEAVVGDGVTIEPFCIVHECRIGKNALIRSHSVVYRDVEIGDGFECGHGVMIRAETRIGVGVRVAPVRSPGQAHDRRSPASAAASSCRS